MAKQFYITTAIDYVNGEPHAGHAYEKVITDVIARCHQSLGERSFFLTGLDEHGQKVQQAALAEGRAPRDYCDELALKWERFAEMLQLGNRDFVRTSSRRHRKVVEAMMGKLYAQGDFYKAPYRGYYSTRQETFLTERDRREDGSFDPIYGEVTELVEDNYYFKLGRHQDWLIESIEANPDFIVPSYRRNEVLGFLTHHVLEDLCISRPVARLGWGIPLPFDPEYVAYVWFDALVNYITVPAAHGDRTILGELGGLGEGAGEGIELWPADVHVIGKDVLKFHAVYWPIMLKAAGLALPRQICVHGWWQKDGRKMSKTTGNVVDPVAVIKEWGVDAFRYYLLRELDIGPDGNWTDGGFEARYTAELANGLGNLVQRSLSMLHRYRNGMVPARSEELAREANAASSRIRVVLREHRLQAALRLIWDYVGRVNQYIDQTAPFKLAKAPDQAIRLDEILYNLGESVRLIAVWLWPFLPMTASRIFAQLGLAETPDQWALGAWGGLRRGHQIQKPVPLFPRKERKGESLLSREG